MLTINHTYPSPNFDERETPIKALIFHYTDMLTAKEALERLCSVEASVSAHYLISEEGEIYQLVDDAKRAWHAGKSFWRGMEKLNNYSIGIELANKGHSHGYHPFPEAQLASLKKLSKQLIATHNIPKENIVGHSDIAPLRKKDPGELFPWQSFAEEGIGFWPPSLKTSTNEMSVLEMQRALSQIGYKISPQGVFDDETKEVLIAFQRHFAPLEPFGELTPFTKAMLDRVSSTISPLKG